MAVRLPYRMDEAKDLCEQLQPLVGYPYNAHTNEYSSIECVAVAPFDMNNMKKFIFSYLLTNDADKALKEEYKFGILHDVVVIARSLSDSNDIVYTEINHWLEKNGFTLQNLLEAFAIDTQVDIAYLKNH